MGHLQEETSKFSCSLVETPKIELRDLWLLFESPAALVRKLKCNPLWYLSSHHHKLLKKFRFVHIGCTVYILANDGKFYVMSSYVGWRYSDELKSLISTKVTNV